MSYVHGDDPCRCSSSVFVRRVCESTRLPHPFWLRDFPVTRPFTSAEQAFHVSLSRFRPSRSARRLGPNPDDTSLSEV